MLPGRDGWVRVPLPPSNLLICRSLFATACAALHVIAVQKHEHDVIAAGLVQSLRRNCGVHDPVMSFFITLDLDRRTCALAGIRTTCPSRAAGCCPCVSRRCARRTIPRVYRRIWASRLKADRLKTSNEAGLRPKNDMYLAEIERNGEVNPVPWPDMRFVGRRPARLFVGRGSIPSVELHRLLCLNPGTNQVLICTAACGAAR